MAMVSVCYQFRIQGSFAQTALRLYRSAPQRYSSSGMQETYHIAHHQSLTDNKGGRPSNVVSGCATGVRLSVLMSSLSLLGLLRQWQKLAAQPYGKFL